MHLTRSPACSRQQLGPGAARHGVRHTTTPTLPCPRPCRRWHVARAAPADGPPRPQEEPSDEEREAIRANVDKATQMLEEILQEVSDEVFIAQATAYLTDEPEDGSPEALRQAVARRLEYLDANFLAALNAYVQVRSPPRLRRPCPAPLPAHAVPLARPSRRAPAEAATATTCRCRRRARTCRWCRC
jgi:hypothetical protein